MSYRIAVALGAAVIGANAAHWAVLIAGSSGFGNYRHQADVCHAYHTLTHNGVPDDHIITFLFDDVATDASNPFPGKLFNKPANSMDEAVDVYANCKKSYTGVDVTTENFLAVLRGNASDVTGGSGEVLQSGPDDEVFINYVNHGAAGMVGMPTGPYLYAYEITATLQFMHDSHMFRKLVFYMEACESGSMFQDLPSNVTVFAATAANADEPSWAGYCPPTADVIGTTHVGACLGDIFSTNWMENADAHTQLPSGGMNESLCEQFTAVQSETATSHVSAYGDLRFLGADISEFQGNSTGRKHIHNASCPAVHSHSAQNPSVVPGAVSARHATRLSLQTRVAAARDELYNEFMHEKVMAALNDDAFDSIARAQLLVPSADMALQLPVRITQWACYRAANEEMHTTACGAYTDYTLQYARIVAMLCEQYDGDAHAVASKLHSACHSAASDVFASSS